MLKETEETIVFFVTFLSLVASQLGWGPGPPLATHMTPKSFANHHMRTLLVEFFNTAVP